MRQASLVCLFGLLLVACAGEVLPPAGTTPTPPPQRLQIGLASSAQELERLVAGPYRETGRPADLHFIAGSDAALFADLSNDLLDAIFVHHIPEGDDNWFNPVALDGLVIIVHPDNPARSLAMAEAQAIFSGRITDWAALGGPERPIQPVIWERGAGIRRIFEERVMAEQRVAITALVQADDQAVLQEVSRNPAAAGYTMMASLPADDSVIALALDSRSAAPESVAAQTYPLTTPLYFVSRQEPTGELRAFLAWLQSDEGQAIIGEKYGRVR